MSKLVAVKVVERTDAYGQAEFDIVTRAYGKYPEGCMCRQGIGSRHMAYEIAERIDAQMTDPSLEGWGGLERI